MLNFFKRPASRKALLALAGAALTFAAHFVPELKPLQGDALILIDALLGVLILGIAVEDGAQKINSGAG